MNTKYITFFQSDIWCMSSIDKYKVHIQGSFPTEELPECGVFWVGLGDTYL